MFCYTVTFCWLKDTGKHRKRGTRVQGLLSLDDLHNTLRGLLPKANLVPTALPLVPSISLYLLDDVWPREQIEAPVINALMADPPYWTFCWASGQGLAWWLLENPQLVQGKTVVDVGSGSGVVAIAAAKAGAKHVIACDIDTNALSVAKLNAELNGVAITLASSLAECIEEAEVITAADILYDPENMPLLELFCGADKVLLADSRVPNLNPKGYQRLGTVKAVTWPDLSELEHLNTVRLFAAGAAEPSA